MKQIHLRYLIHLKDGRIACYSDADIIEIFDIAKEKRDLIITIKDNSIKSVCQIDNVYTDKAFLIYSIGKDTYQTPIASLRNPLLRHRNRNHQDGLG